MHGLLCGSIAGNFTHLCMRIGVAWNSYLFCYVAHIMAMTKQEREVRDAAFALLMEGMRGGRKDEPNGEQLGEQGLHGEICAARRRRGWTQEELARRTGTTQSAIARLESGRALPRMRTLRRLAEALDARLVVRLETD